MRWPKWLSNVYAPSTSYSTCRFYRPTVRALATDCKRILFYFSVCTITHEPLHAARWNFARTCSSKTFETLLNFKVKGQGHMSFYVFLCVHSCGCPRTVLSLEQGLMMMFVSVFINSNVWLHRAVVISRYLSYLSTRGGGSMHWLRHQSRHKILIVRKQ